MNIRIDLSDGQARLLGLAAKFKGVTVEALVRRAIYAEHGALAEDQAFLAFVREATFADDLAKVEAEVKAILAEGQ